MSELTSLWFIALKHRLIQKRFKWQSSIPVLFKVLSTAFPTKVKVRYFSLRHKETPLPWVINWMENMLLDNKHSYGESPKVYVNSLSNQILHLGQYKGFFSESFYPHFVCFVALLALPFYNHNHKLRKFRKDHTKEMEHWASLPL